MINLFVEAFREKTSLLINNKLLIVCKNVLDLYIPSGIVLTTDIGVCELVNATFIVS